MTAGICPILLDSGLSARGVRDRCGLYIHVPFCETKCGYCDFFSVAVKDRDTAPLVDCVIRELLRRTTDRPHALTTVFCGGGTPTILPVGQLDALLQAIGQTTADDAVEEFTVEANPATVDAEKAKLLVDRGVTRVSMGAQSFFREELAALERLHTPGDIEPSVRVLRDHAVRQINLDLIFGIPGQTLSTWNESLRCAIDLGLDHIACYGLTYEPGTRLTAQRKANRVTPCDEGLEAEMYLHAIDVLADSGFEQYETSNFAKPGCACKHNLIYWRNEPYIAVGPSAAGCVGGRRYKNVPDVARYVRMIDSLGHAEIETEEIDPKTLMIEMVMMQLRLVEGLSISDFGRRTSADPHTLFAGALTRLTDLDLLTVSDTHIALTRTGRLVGDAVISDLVDTIPGKLDPTACAESA